jgi:hypothetical protein
LRSNILSLFGTGPETAQTLLRRELVQSSPARRLSRRAVPTLS